MVPERVAVVADEARAGERMVLVTEAATMEVAAVVGSAVALTGRAMEVRSAELVEADVKLVMTAATRSLALQSQRPERWQPMSTAPATATATLLHNTQNLLSLDALQNATPYQGGSRPPLSLGPSSSHLLVVLRWARPVLAWNRCGSDGSWRRVCAAWLRRAWMMHAVNLGCDHSRLQK